MRNETFYDVASIIIFWGLYGICSLLIIWWGIGTFLSLNVLDLAVIAIATFRLAHLISYDKVFGFARRLFMVHRGKENVPPQRGIRLFIYELLDCLWCTGMWSALIALTAYCVNIWGRFSVDMFAVAGVASLLQLISHNLNAALKK